MAALPHDDHDHELGRETPWIGFHTFGEIAPIAGETFYHNFTVALCALYEAA